MHLQPATCLMPSLFSLNDCKLLPESPKYRLVVQNIVILRQAGLHWADVGGDAEGASRAKHLAAAQSGFLDRRHERRGRLRRPQPQRVSSFLSFA